jgi:hypothetical protein
MIDRQIDRPIPMPFDLWCRMLRKRARGVFRNAHRSCPVECAVSARRSAHGAIYTQRHQDRLQRLGREATKREEVYADFIMSASKVLLNAYVHDGVTLTGDGQHLAGLINRMRLFAPPNIINEAEAVIRGLVEISLKPSVEFPKVAAELFKDRQSDLLLRFSVACRADLDNVYRTGR